MIKIDDVAKVYKIERRNGHLNTTRVLHDLILQGLGPQQRRILRAFPSYGMTTTSKIHKKTGIQVKVICNALHRMSKLGLIDHEKVIHENGMYFKWRLVHAGWLHEG